MRLIDADLLKGRYICNRTYCGVNKLIGIDSIPTAYDVDKVVELLNEYAHSEICKSHNGCPYKDNKDMDCENCGAMGTLEIVKSGGIE